MRGGLNTEARLAEELQLGRVAASGKGRNVSEEWERAAGDQACKRGLTGVPSDRARVGIKSREQTEDTTVTSFDCAVKIDVKTVFIFVDVESLRNHH